MKTVSTMTPIAFLAVLALLLASGTSQGAAVGEARVVSVDRPENCLRIRSGPGSDYAVVGCLEKGAVLQLTGNRTTTNWAEIAKPMKGWVWGPQVSQGKAVRGSAGPGVAYGETPGVHRPYSRSYRYPQGSGFYYGGPGARVRVGPGGGVAVGVGGVGVRVGPGGVGVRVR